MCLSIRGGASASICEKAQWTAGFCTSVTLFEELRLDDVQRICMSFDGKATMGICH